MTRSAALAAMGRAHSTAAASRPRARRRDTGWFLMGGSHTDSGGRAAAMASHNGHATHRIGDEIRAERACKIVNSGSPQRFQPQPSLRGGALRWMQAKLLEICPPGLTGSKPLWFSRSHVAAHSHPRIHPARRHRRRLDPFASCPRTYYPTNRCGTDRRVSKTARYPSKPAPTQVRVFSFQSPSIFRLPHFFLSAKGLPP